MTIPVEETQLAKFFGVEIAQHGYMQLPHVVRRRLKRLLTGPQYALFEEILFWFELKEGSAVLSIAKADLGEDMGLSRWQVGRLLKELRGLGYLKLLPQAYPMTVAEIDLTPGLEKLAQLAQGLTQDKLNKKNKKNALPVIPGAPLAGEHGVQYAPTQTPQKPLHKVISERVAARVGHRYFVEADQLPLELEHFAHNYDLRVDDPATVDRYVDHLVEKVSGLAPAPTPEPTPVAVPQMQVIAEAPQIPADPKPMSLQNELLMQAAQVYAERENAFKNFVAKETAVPSNASQLDPQAHMLAVIAADDAKKALQRDLVTKLKEESEQASIAQGIKDDQDRALAEEEYFVQLKAQKAERRKIFAEAHGFDLGNLTLEAGNRLAELMVLDEMQRP